MWEDHGGGEGEVAEDGGLVHADTVGWAGGRDDVAVRRGVFCEEGEDAGELGGAQVVEDGVAAVEEDADAA